jgi:integrase
VFRFARDKLKLRGLNPTAELGSYGTPAERRRYLGDKDGSEVERLFRACEVSNWDRLGLFVRLAVSTGMRKSELLGLTWSDIDFAAGTATLDTTKNGLPRVVYLSPDMLEELQPWRGIGDALVFPDPVKPSQPKNPQRPWKLALKLAGIEGLTIHDLRHTAASWAVQAGEPLYSVAHMLGHKSLAVTKHYAHLNPAAHRDVVGAVEARLAKERGR